MHTIRISLALLVTGCASAHTPEGLGTGIYDLMIEGDVEECAPARPTGVMGSVAVVVDGDAIDVPVPDAASPLSRAPRVVLSPDTWFYSETNRNVAGCDGAWVLEAWSIVSSDVEALELDHMQAWSGTESCGAESEAPRADCRSERHFRYSLRTACAAPCELTTEGEEVACSCP